MKIYEGSCGCGAVNYSFSGEPVNSVFCYCKECQVRTGSDKWFGLWVQKENFTFTKGTPLTFTRPGDSGQAMHHQFCGACGTNLCVEVTVANIYSVAATTLIGNHLLSPKIAIYTASAPSWAVFPEGVPKFDILPPGLGD
ncbi:MAG: GFA family protein [Pseudomonas sp.]|uniref:GFA family protein n=1 Tax=Pseudomonas sp. TaxID=306 RepID=UPI0027375CD6|nr:GFA family protein [Pseudomonas sp.]MDP3846647.1 GFA family protein [Pseudomonas sp.]